MSHEEVACWALIDITSHICKQRISFSPSWCWSNIFTETSQILFFQIAWMMIFSCICINCLCFWGTIWMQHRSLLKWIVIFKCDLCCREQTELCWCFLEGCRLFGLCYSASYSTNTSRSQVWYLKFLYHQTHLWLVCLVIWWEILCEQLILKHVY